MRCDAPGQRPCRRGDVWWADLDPTRGSEQGGVRPVLVLQSDTGNEHGTTTIVAPLTSQVAKCRLPVHVVLRGAACGLARDSAVLCDQVRTIDRCRLRHWVGRLDGEATARVEAALLRSLGMDRLEAAASGGEAHGPDR